MAAANKSSWFDPPNLFQLTVVIHSKSTLLHCLLRDLRRQSIVTPAASIPVIVQAAVPVPVAGTVIVPALVCRPVVGIISIAVIPTLVTFLVVICPPAWLTIPLAAVIISFPSVTSIPPAAAAAVEVVIIVVLLPALPWPGHTCRTVPGSSWQQMILCF